MKLKFYKIILKFLKKPSIYNDDDYGDEFKYEYHFPKLALNIICKIQDIEGFPMEININKPDIIKIVDTYLIQRDIGEYNQKHMQWVENERQQNSYRPDDFTEK